MSLSAWIKRNCSPETTARLRRYRNSFYGWRYRNDLNRLALALKTDKWGGHWYTQHYDAYFRSIRFRKLNVLEIGVGGYQNEAAGGGSLRMWKAYFPNSRIVGIDLYDKSQVREHRIDFRQCDQTDAEALTRLSNEYGGFDIVIDDGSHVSEHVIKTFHVLFPLLRPNGIYAVEDLQTAYWPTWGGGMNDPSNSVSFLKGLVDGLNHVEFPVPDYEPSYFDKNIVELAFFHNLAIIRKGENSEKACDPALIQREIDEMAAPQQ